MNNRIAILRKEKGLSQGELGKIVGAAQNTISNWEKGLRQPDNTSLKKLSDIFDVSIDYLLCKDDNIMQKEKDLLDRIIKKMTPKQRKKLLCAAMMIFDEHSIDNILSNLEEDFSANALHD